MVNSLYDAAVVRILSLNVFNRKKISAHFGYKYIKVAQLKTRTSLKNQTNSLKLGLMSI